jgi:hypothetical protein
MTDAACGSVLAQIDDAARLAEVEEPVKVTWGFVDAVCGNGRLSAISLRQQANRSVFEATSGQFA